ncbi:MAG: TM0106 family RecB-like putative nuclease [Planctomycetota bacterium]
MADRKGRALTGNVVYNHFGHACRYRLRLDLLGDRRERSAPSATGRYLMERGNRLESEVFEKIRRDHPDDIAEIAADPEATDREQDFARRTALTLEAMRQGKRFILHGFLSSEPGDIVASIPGLKSVISDLVMRGETDLLVRVDEPSPGFGKWSYQVGDVKSSRQARFPQKMQVTFYSWLLEKRQGQLPTRGFIVTGDGRRESFDIDETIWTLRHFLEEEVHECLADEAAFYHLDFHCSYCHWRDHCRQRAQENDDLSLVPSLRRPDKRALLQSGVHSRRDLLQQNDTDLRSMGRRYGNRLDGFRDLKRRASAQEFKTALLRQHPRLQTAAGKDGLGSPDLFRHRGPMLLIASLADHYHGCEAAMATALVRRRGSELEAGFERPRVSFGAPGRGEELFDGLYAQIAEIAKLCAAQGERALPLFANRRVIFLLRREAEATGHSAAISGIEQLLADSMTIPDLVDRTFYLPEEPDHHDDYRRLLAKSSDDTPPLRPSLLDTENVAAFFEQVTGESPVEAGRIAVAAPDLVRRVARDYELDLDVEDFEKVPGDLTTLIVREWRRSEDDAWRDLIRFELGQELQSARFVLGALFRTGRSPAVGGKS